MSAYTHCRKCNVVVKFPYLILYHGTTYGPVCGRCMDPIFSAHAFTDCQPKPDPYNADTLTMFVTIERAAVTPGQACQLCWNENDPARLCGTLYGNVCESCLFPGKSHD